MPRFRLLALPDLNQISKSKMIYYGATTCWWGDKIHYISPIGVGLPVDPRGGVLMETDNAEQFIRLAGENALLEQCHYGRHRIDAFRAAFHGVIEVLTADGRGWRPTCFPGWGMYNDILDCAHPNTGECECPETK